jgi:hypothetical protein
MIAFNSGASFRKGETFIITKVIDTPNTLQYSGVSFASLLVDVTSTPRVSYRTSGFGVATGGWILMANNSLAGVLPAPQIQFKIEYNPNDGIVNNVRPISEAFVSLIESTSMSDNWSGSVANSSQPSATPFYAAFRLEKAYVGGMPRLYVRVVDDSGTISVFDTVTHNSLFSFSSNNGTSWSAYTGIIPNIAKTTEVRLNISSPSGNPITCGILEY